MRVLPKPDIRRFPLGVARGLRLEVDFQYETRLFLGLYELEIARYFRRLVVRGAPAIDVGGNSGYDALLIAKLSGDRVTTIEPDGKLVARLRANLAANPEVGRRISVEEAWAGAAPDPSARVITLDELDVDGSRPPAFVKIDVDGGEADVLSGAGQLLRNYSPNIIIETHTPELEVQCGRMLVECGYAPVVVNQRALWPDRRPIPHNRWLVARGALRGDS